MNFGQNKYYILIFLALVWGTSFILIKKSVDIFTPYQVGALRMIISGVSLSFIGIPAIRRMNAYSIKWVVIAGFFGSFLTMFLFPMAEVKVSSSLAGILNSLVPIFTLIFGYLLFRIENTKLQILGAILGFFGACILMYFSGNGVEGNSNILYALLVVLATASYALSGLIVKDKLQHIKSLELSGAIFVVWIIPAFIILIFSGFFHSFEGSSEQWDGLGYVFILALLGTALAMILFYKLIQQTTAVFASSVTYLMPVVAIGWGVLAGESLNVWFIPGGLLILVGIYLIKEKK